MVAHVIFSGPTGSGKSELLNALQTKKRPFGEQVPTPHDVDVDMQFKLKKIPYDFIAHDGPTASQHLNNPTSNPIAAVIYCHDLQQPIDEALILTARDALKNEHPFAHFILVGTHVDVLASDDTNTLTTFDAFGNDNGIEHHTLFVRTTNRANNGKFANFEDSVREKVIAADRKIHERSAVEVGGLSGEQLVSVWQQELQATAMNPAMLNFLAQMQASTLDDAKKKALALELHAMLLVLQNNVSTVDEKTHAITEFNDRCKGILNGPHPNWVAFGKAVGIVAASAAVLLLTVAAGFTAGLLLGLWTGPGALVSAVLGGVMAAQIGAGATAGTAVVATALTAGLMGWGLFKTPALVTAVDSLVVDADNTLTPVI